MRNTAFYFYLIFTILFFTSSLYAQKWTSEQHEVWRIVSHTWDLIEKDEDWIEKYVHKDCLIWDNSTQAPRNKESLLKWNRYSKELRKIKKVEITPLGIVVMGNTAVCHYFYTEAFDTYDGKKKSENGRFTDILIKTPNGWQFIAWHGGPNSE